MLFCEHDVGEAETAHEVLRVRVSIVLQCLVAKGIIRTCMPGKFYSYDKRNDCEA